jgi:hypothetical protein
MDELYHSSFWVISVALKLVFAQIAYIAPLLIAESYATDRFCLSASSSGISLQGPSQPITPRLRL